jgi:hypothetical protein
MVPVCRDLELLNGVELKVMEEGFEGVEDGDQLGAAGGEVCIAKNR